MFTISRHRFLATTLAMLLAIGSFSAASAQNPPVEPPANPPAIDASDAELPAQNPDPGTGQMSGGQDERMPQQAIIDHLVLQLDQLIPGEYETDSVQYDKLFDIANFFASGDEPLVRAKITELAELDSNLPPPDLLLAGLAFSANNPLQGKALLERAGTTDRQHPGIALAFAQLAIAQDRMFDASALIEKTRLQIEASKLDDATKEFYGVGVLKTLTVIETRRRDFRRARDYASQWEKLEPDGNDMLMATAEIEFLLENPDSAVAYLNRRAAEPIAELPTEVVMAKWYRGTNNAENHAKWIQLAHEKYPSNMVCQIEYGAWLIFTEQFDQAAELVAKIESEHGESTDTGLIKGRIAFAKEDFANAEALFGALYAKQPADFEHSYLYTLAMLESGEDQKLQQAAALAQRNVQLHPNNQLALASMGWALLKIGKPDVAQQLLSRASNTGDMMPDTAYFVAKLMVDMDRKVQARTVLEPFLESDQTFLFRPAAKRLIESIEREAQLPEPGEGG